MQTYTEYLFRITTDNVGIFVLVKCETKLDKEINHFNF